MSLIIQLSIIIQYLNILGSIDVENNITVRQNAQIMQNLDIEGSLSSSTNNINITPYEHMIAPFYINFTNPNEINILQSKSWYLYNGEKHRRGNNNTRTTHDLRGRFIWGSGNLSSRVPDPSLPAMTTPDDTEDTSYQEWGTNAGYDEEEGYHTLTEGELPPHSHGIRARRNWDVNDQYNNQFQYGDMTIETHHQTGGVNVPNYISDTGLRKSHNNLPPYMVLTYFIYWSEPWNSNEPWNTN